MSAISNKVAKAVPLIALAGTGWVMRGRCSSLIQAAHPRMQPRQSQQDVGEWRGDAGQLAELLDDRDERIEFHRLARLHVLQHRRLERAELARDLVTVFRLLRDRDADARADLLG